MYQLLKGQAERTPDAIAITVPGHTPLLSLLIHIDHVVETLHAMGLGRNNRVAIVLPNGPEMATAFVTVTACATNAPLDPTYRSDEMGHPSLAQAVTFAIPYTKLCDDVAAAVVLHENALATEREIRQSAATRLVNFKVPGKALILDEIPKGATGKPQRTGSAEELGLTAHNQAEQQKCK